MKHILHTQAPVKQKTSESIFILNRSLLQKWERIEMNTWTLSNFLPSLWFLKNQRFWDPSQKIGGFGSVGSAVGSMMGICKTSTLRSLCRFVGFEPKWPLLWLEFRPWQFGGWKFPPPKFRGQTPRFQLENRFTKKLRRCYGIRSIFQFWCLWKNSSNKNKSPKKGGGFFFMVWFVSQQWAQK